MKDLMRAVVLHAPGELQLQKIPVPRPGAQETLVRVAACGICGSDLRYLAGENPWARHTLGHDKPNPPDMILGHEVAGFAELSGTSTPVACLAFRSCGRCRQCRRGDIHLCAHTAHLGHGAGWQGANPGGMAEYCPVWTENLFPLPQELTPEEATLLDGMAVAVHAVRSLGVFPGDAVAVLGAGAIGLLIAQVALCLGAGRTVLCDRVESGLACGREVGVADTYNTGEDGLSGFVARSQNWAPGGYALVYDTTGDRDVQQAGLDLLAPGGTLVLMAGMAEGFTVTAKALAGERRVTTRSNHLYEDFSIALELVSSGRVLVKPMITHRFPLAEYEKAFAAAANKETTGAIKVVLTVE